MLKRSHPAAIGAYFLCALGLTVFSSDPYTVGASLIGAIFMLASLGGLRGGRALIAPFALFLLSALANPLFSHRGRTELLFINGQAITLEALIAGSVTGAAFAAALLLCSSMTLLLDDAKIMYLIGRRAPKCAIVLTGAFKFFPELMVKYRATQDAQKAVGRLPDEKPIDRLRSTLRVWSALIGLAFEGAREQAELICVSGFDEDRARCPMEQSKFRFADAAFLAATLLLTATAIALTLVGENEILFYPVFSVPSGMPAVISRGAAAVLFLMPAVTNIIGDVKWLFLKSKI